jgi:hypothetical protein
MLSKQTSEKTYTVFIITRLNGARNAPEQRKMRIVEERTAGQLAAPARPQEGECDIITVSERHVSYHRNKYPSRNEHSD